MAQRRMSCFAFWAHWAVHWTHIRGLLTPLITTHEPPSIEYEGPLWSQTLNPKLKSLGFAFELQWVERLFSKRSLAWAFEGLGCFLFF